MLHVHRSDRADGLIEALRELLAEPPADPFAPELVCVPTRGMERWLTQRLSLGARDLRQRRVPVPAPADRATRSRRRPGSTRRRDPWLPERLVWPLLEVVDEARDEAWLAPHLPTEPARRFAAVRHLAQLFDRYALHRPEVLERRPLAGRAVAAAGRADRRARSGGADGERVRAAARGAGARGAAGALLAVRPHAPARRPARGPARARRAPRRAPLPAAPVARAVGADRGAGRARASAAPTTPRRGWPRNRLLASWGQDVARAAARARARTSSATSTRSQHALGHDARAPAGGGARGPPARAGRRPTAASRSTPATAARARSRSSATRSCTCSRRTRRSSRAT